jgi:hypothetical protein
MNPVGLVLMREALQAGSLAMDRLSSGLREKSRRICLFCHPEMSGILLPRKGGINAERFAWSARLPIASR